MKKGVLLTLVFILITSLAHAAELSGKTKIVILPFKNVSNQEDEYNASNKIASTLAGKLAEMGRFEVIDRTELETILEEQKLSLSGVIDVEQAVEVGKVASAKLAFTGNILSMNVYQDVDVETKTADLGIIKLEKTEEKKKKEWIAKLKINIKILDIETGELIDSFEEEAEYETDEVHTKQSAIDGAIDQATFMVPYELKTLFKIKSYILLREGNTAIIRLGEDLGIRKGMEFYISDKESKVKDNNTGEMLTIGGEKKGLLYVTSVDESSAYAKIVRGKGSVKKGDVLTEKMFPSISIDLSVGLAPFKMDKFFIPKSEGYIDSDENYLATISLDQKSVENVPYINLNLKKAYRAITPSLDTTLYLNSPITVFGSDLNINMIAELFEFIGVELTGGMGVRIGYNNIGNVKEVDNGDSGILDFLFGKDKEFEDGADIDLTGFSFALKGQAKSFINISDSMSFYGEAGYTYATDMDWEIDTKGKDDKSVDLTSNFKNELEDIPELDMSGIYYGGGIRFTF